MKISIRKMFVLLAIVMSLGFVQAGWALDCSETVSGTIELLDDGKVEVTDELGGLTTISGIPDSLNLATTEVVTIIYSERPCGDLVACSVTVGGDTTNLRPGKGKSEELVAQSVTVAADTDCVCDNCYCKCPEDCEDCTCDCSCDCICDGTGPYGPKK